MKTFFMLLLSLLLSSLAYGQFIEVNAGLPAIGKSSISWGDYDNDGDLDILMTGDINSSTKATRIFHHNSDNTFTDIVAGLPEIDLSSADWGDYDNDGWLDILLTGWTHLNTSISKIFHNNQNGTFSEINAGMIGLSYGAAKWGDFDNDGRLDALINGDMLDLSRNIFCTCIYGNNGDGTFTDFNAALQGTYWGALACADYNNDGALDFIMIGEPTYSSTSTRLYSNNGDNTFSDINAYLIQLGCGSVAWGNFDNDADPDLLITGYNYDASSYNARVYRNNGNNTFSNAFVNLAGVTDGSAAWGDYDNDGDLDFVYSGYLGTPQLATARLYRNDGNSTFTYVNSGFTGVDGPVVWGDFDNDGNLDLMLGGFTQSGYVFEVYRNTTAVVNNPPAAPTDLYQYREGDYTVFNWNAPADDHTDANHLTYVLRIGTTPGGCDIASPMSSNTGLRRIAAQGYVNANRFWKIKTSALPAVAHYFWTVQAIDTAFKGSAFAPEIEVDPTGNNDPANSANVDIALSAYPNPFRGQTTLNFRLKKPARVRIDIYNLKGQLVSTLLNNTKTAGDHQLVWSGTDNNGSRVKPGLYFVRLSTGKLVSTCKLLVLQ